MAGDVLQVRDPNGHWLALGASWLPFGRAEGDCGMAEKRDGVDNKWRCAPS